MLTKEQRKQREFWMQVVRTACSIIAALASTTAAAILILTHWK